MADVECLFNNPTNPAPKIYILPSQGEGNIDLECTLEMDSDKISPATTGTATRAISPDFDADLVIVDQPAVIELDSILVDPVQVPVPTPESAPAPASGPRASAHAPFVAVVDSSELTPAQAPVPAMDPVEIIKSDESMKPLRAIQSSQPMEPVFPAKFPEVSRKPSQPSQPSQPMEPVFPATFPEVPGKPIQPSQPMEPAFPATFPKVSEKTIQSSQPMEPSFPATFPTTHPESPIHPTTPSLPIPLRTFTLTSITSTIHHSPNGLKIASQSRMARLTDPESSWKNIVLLISGSAVPGSLMVFYTLVCEWEDFMRFLKIHGGLEEDGEGDGDEGLGNDKGKEEKRYRMVIRLPSYDLGCGLLASSQPSSMASVQESAPRNSQSSEADLEAGAIITTTTTITTPPTAPEKERIITKTSTDYAESAAVMKKLLEAGQVDVWDQTSFDCAMQLVHIFGKKEVMVEIEEKVF
ncbi:hypothetical protein BZA77DRAFT_177027 [Pyronema omphalodes]|nr:hypothetical protein BZA77DRAFT_177027 [Pyronema omphalodes]